jgi:hypothetical protein
MTCAFAKAVNDHLTPLLAARGFTCARADETRVVFQSPDVVVDVTRNAFSFEIDVDVWLSADRETLASRVHLIGYQASTPERLDECMRIVAAQFLGPGERLLAGDRDAFADATRIAKAHNAEYTRKIVLAPTPQSAEDAWAARDLAAVARLYGGIEADLTEIERARLRYARLRATDT